jgi:hypothetical protein
MVRIKYNSSIADYIKLEFICGCGEHIETELLPVRQRYDGNKNVNSFSCVKPIVCKRCKQQHDISFYDDCYNAYCEISTISDEKNIIYLHEIPYENAYYNNDLMSALTDYITEIVKLKDFLEQSEDINVFEKSTIYKMAVVYAISIFDAYFGNTFRYFVRSYEIFRNRYLSYRCKNKKLTLKSVFKKLEYQSFQNLEEIVVPYYEKTFGIKIPKNDVIIKGLNYRNKIVHNSGREKDGYEYKVNKTDVEQLINEIQNTINFVNSQMVNVINEEIICKNWM